MPDIVSERLGQTEDDEEAIEVEVSDREQEFSKVTDILMDVRDRFLGSDTMSFNDAILEIQDELAKLAPPRETPARLPAMPPMGPMVPGGGGGISGLPVPPTRM